mgnify:CR=1 FL=1
MFRTSTAAAPVRYYYTKDTTILDPEGHTVTWSAIRPDMPATVYYTNVGDRVVVRKVVLSQPRNGLREERNHHNNNKALIAKDRSLVVEIQRRSRNAFRERFFVAMSLREAWHWELILHGSRRPQGDGYRCSIAVAMWKFLVPFPGALDNRDRAIETAAASQARS